LQGGTAVRIRCPVKGSAAQGGPGKAATQLDAHTRQRRR
jgi:hypothetical protein